MQGFEVLVRSWDFITRAMGSHGRTLSRRVPRQDLHLEIYLWRTEGRAEGWESRAFSYPGERWWERVHVDG